MTTRRLFLGSAVGLAGFGTGLGASVYAQGRIRPVDPLDVVTQQLCLALREKPSAAMLKLVTNVFATVIETSGLAKQIDALIARPDAAQQIFNALNDHTRHAADDARARAFAPNLPPMQMRPPANPEQVASVVALFRSLGFAETLRQMAEALPRDARAQSLDYCPGWWYGCLIWEAATVWVCIIPSGAGCLLGFLITSWICAQGYYC